MLRQRVPRRGAKSIIGIERCRGPSRGCGCPFFDRLSGQLRPCPIMSPTPEPGAIIVIHALGSISRRLRKKAAASVRMDSCAAGRQTDPSAGVLDSVAEVGERLMLAL